jgi:hypothetical protein
LQGYDRSRFEILRFEELGAHEYPYVVALRCRVARE